MEGDWERVPGVLDVGTMGCAYRTYLVVNGEFIGEIWESWENDEVWPTHVTFSAWVRDWAQRNITRVIRERITDQIKIGMTKSQVETLCSENLVSRNISSAYHRIENFATAVDLDANEKVVRIIKHSV